MANYEEYQDPAADPRLAFVFGNFGVPIQVCEILPMSMDMDGSLMLQSIIDEGDRGDLVTTFEEILPALPDMLTHPYANHVVCALYHRFYAFDTQHDDEYCASLAWPLYSSLVDFMTNRWAHHFVLLALTTLPPYKVGRLLADGLEEYSAHIAALYAIPQVRNIFNQVIRMTPVSDLGPLLTHMTGDAFGYATDPARAMALERVISAREWVETQVWIMIARLFTPETRCTELCSHRIGNHVVQTILLHTTPDQLAEVFHRILPHFAFLCCDNYGRWVTRELVTHSVTPAMQQAIVTHLQTTGQFDNQDALWYMTTQPQAHGTIRRMFERFYGAPGDWLRAHCIEYCQAIRDTVAGTEIWNRLQGLGLLPAPVIQPPAEPEPEAVEPVVVEEVPALEPEPQPEPDHFVFLDIVNPMDYPASCPWPVASGPFLPEAPQERIRPSFGDEAYPPTRGDLCIQPGGNWVHSLDPVARLAEGVGNLSESHYRIRDFAGHLLSLAVTASGGQFLQSRLERSTEDLQNPYEATLREIEMLYNELRGYIRELARLTYSCYVLCRLMQYATAEILTDAYDKFRERTAEEEAAIEVRTRRPGDNAPFNADRVQFRYLARHPVGGFFAASLVENLPTYHAIRLLDTVGPVTMGRLRENGSIKVYVSAVHRFGFFSGPTAVLTQAVSDTFERILFDRGACILVQLALDSDFTPTLAREGYPGVHGPDNPLPAMQAMRGDLMERFLAIPNERIRASVRRPVFNVTLQRFLQNCTHDQGQQMLLKLHGTVDHFIEIFETEVFERHGMYVLQRLLRFTTENDQERIVQVLLAEDDRRDIVYPEDQAQAPVVLPGFPILRMATCLGGHYTVRQMLHDFQGNPRQALAQFLRHRQPYLALNRYGRAILDLCADQLDEHA